ncbi:MAG: hypothetical protein AAGA85_06520 [Bacteroidota bacterium]
MADLRTPKQIFDELSSAQRRFLLEKDASGKRTATAWLEFLKPIVAFDILVDNSSKKLRHALRLLAFMAAFNLLVALIIGNGWVGATGGLMAFLAAYQWSKLRANVKRDLHNHLRDYFVPLLSYMVEGDFGEMVVEAKFQLREKDQRQYVIEGSIGEEVGGIRFAITRDSYTVDFGVKHVEGKLGKANQLVGDVMQFLS